MTALALHERLEIALDKMMVSGGLNTDNDQAYAAILECREIAKALRYDTLEHDQLGCPTAKTGIYEETPERVHVATVSAAVTCQRDQPLPVFPCGCGAMNAAACGTRSAGVSMMTERCYHGPDDSCPNCDPVRFGTETRFAWVSPTPMPVSRYRAQGAGMGFNGVELVAAADGDLVMYGDYEALERLYLQHVAHSAKEGR